MTNWDDVRFFLAVARNGSIRAAAAALDVNHATVSRRVAAMEKDLGVRLFEKLPTGYVITPASEEILELAERMEEQVNTLERRVYGRDAGLTGKLRVTLPQALATHLIMPDLVRFARVNPGIELEIITSYETLNLTKRQADVAIRLVYENQSPPEHLYGRRLASVHRAIYVSENLMDRRGSDAITSSLDWVVKEEDGPLPSWATHSATPPKGISYVVSDLLAVIAATREGLGASILPCFIGDRDTGLERLSPGRTKLYGELWILTHSDIRNTPRVRAFTEFMADAIRDQKALLEGAGQT